MQLLGWVAVVPSDAFSMTNRFIQILAFVASLFFGVVVYGQTPTVGVVFPEPSCPADFNGNYFVEVEDLLNMLTSFGCTSNCEGDLDSDGAVGIGDLLVLLSGLGAPCPY